MRTNEASSCAVLTDDIMISNVPDDKYSTSKLSKHFGSKKKSGSSSCKAVSIVKSNTAVVRLEDDKGMHRCPLIIRSTINTYKSAALYNITAKTYFVRRIKGGRIGYQIIKVQVTNLKYVTITRSLSTGININWFNTSSIKVQSTQLYTIQHKILMGENIDNFLAIC